MPRWRATRTSPAGAVWAIEGDADQAEDLLVELRRLARGGDYAEAVVELPVVDP